MYKFIKTSLHITHTHITYISITSKLIEILYITLVLPNSMAYVSGMIITIIIPIAHFSLIFFLKLFVSFPVNVSVTIVEITNIVLEQNFFENNFPRVSGQ